MNNLKKISLVLLALVFLTSLVFVACTPSQPSNPQKPGLSAADALKNYIFELDGQALTESQLELPAVIGGHNVTWTSDSENLKVVKVDATDKDPAYFLATATRPEVDEVTVNLTLTFNDTVSKTYTVRIAAITLHDVMSSYVFPLDKAVVTKDFELDSSVTYEGKTATITWSVAEGSEDYLEVEGYTCHVFQTSVETQVYLVGTFAIGNETVVNTYTMYVSQEQSHLQQVDYWYNNEGVSLPLSGYVVEMSEPYTGQFKNTTFYMIDEDFCCGYYIYRGGIDDTNGALMQRGAYVTVTGATNTDYNGLWETNAGGNVVVDTSKSISIEELEAKVYAIDQDILGDVPAAKYHQSTMVSLTNWTVKEIKAAADVTKSTNVLFVLTKGGVDVPVYISKYFKCAYAYTADDADTQALIALQSTLQVGDVVSLKGILGNYNGHQIALQDASHITVGGTADAEGTVYDGQTAKAAIDEVNKLWADNGLNDLVTLNKEINLVTAHNGVAIEYSLLANPQSADITAGKLTITAGKQEKVGVQITFTVNDYSTVMFKYFSSVALDDQGKADLEADELTLDFEEIKKDGTIALPAVGSIFGAEIAWAIDGTCDFATVEGNVLTVTLPAEASSLRLVATITVGDKVATAEFVVAVAAKVFVSTCPAEGNYVIKLNTASSDLASDIYFDGGINNSEYLTTVTDINNAAVVTFAKVDGGYTLKVGDKYIEVYTNTNSKVRPTLVDTATGVWTWNEDVKVLVWDVDGTEYYLGSYTSSGTTFNTLSASKLSYISGDNASKIDVSQFPMHFADAPIVEDFDTVLGAYNAAKVTAPAVGTAYKFALYCAEDGLAYYLAKDYMANGAAYKLATTTVIADAADVYVEVVSGGYQLYLVDNGVNMYLEPAANGTGASMTITENPSVVLTITDGYFIGSVDNVGEIFMGGYKNSSSGAVYKEIRGSKASYLTSNPDNQYPARLVRGDVDINSYATPVEHVCESVCDTCGGCKDDACTEAVCATKCSCAPVVIPAPVAGTYYVTMQLSGGKVYFNGLVANTHYLGTSTNVAEAAVITLAYVEGSGYTMQLEDGNYLAVVPSGTYRNAKMVPEVSYWQWNSEVGVFTMTIEGTEYYIGTYGTYTTISASSIDKAATSYITVLEAVTVEEPDPSVHVCESKCEICGKCTDADCTEAVCADKCAGHAVEEIPAPVAGTYNLVLTRDSGKFYFTGAMDTHYFATSESQADAVVVTLAYVDGQGYTMQLEDGNYLAVVVNGSYNNIVMQADAAYWQWNSEYGIFTITISTGEFFMGTRNDRDYTTISPCAMSYVETNYKANLEAVTVEEPVHTCESKCEICGKCTDADCTEEVCAVKCEGHEVVEPTHTCQNVCEECGKCTNVDCTEAVCADKCAGHEVVEPTYETKTLAEFLALADDNTTHYKVSGIVHDIYNTTYGNLHLLDGTTDLTVYGLCANVMAFESNKWVNVQDFASLGIKEGDYITIIAAKGSYNGAGQAVGSGLDSIGTAPDAMAVDVAKQVLKVEETLTADYKLPTLDFVTIAWSAPADSAIVIEEGVAKVTRGAEDVTVVLTAVISSGETSSNVEFEVTVSAAPQGTVTTVRFELGKDGTGHKDGTDTNEDATYTETVEGYTLSISGGSKMYTGGIDLTGNGCLKLGTSSKAGSFNIAVPAGVKTVKIYVAGYKAKAASISINGGASQALTGRSDNGTYDCIEVEVGNLTTISVAVSSGYRAMVNAIEFILG